jgi:hypothetical protein
LPAPESWSPNIVAGKRFNTEAQEGRRLWAAVLERISASAENNAIAAAGNERYGNPVLIKPRLGQGAFRLSVTDSYKRRCAYRARRRSQFSMQPRKSNEAVPVTKTGRKWYRLGAHSSRMNRPSRGLAPARPASMASARLVSISWMCMAPRDARCRVQSVPLLCGRAKRAVRLLGWHPPSVTS